MSEWQQRLGILSPTHTEHKFGGVDHHFYPISGSGLAHVFTLAKEVGDAIVEVVSAVSTGDDKGLVRKQQQTGTDFLEETSESPLTPEMAKARHDMKQDAFGKVFDLALKESTHEALAFLIMDSLREIFPRDASNGQATGWPSTKEFLANPKMDIPILVQGAIGIVKANKGVLGPFEEHLDTLLQVAKEKINEVLDLDEDKEPELEILPSQNSNDPMSGSQTEDNTEVSGT